MNILARHRIAVPLVVLTTLAAQAASATTSAATRLSCHIVIDRSGDATHLVGHSGDIPNQAEVDITSADVASNARFVTTVLRLLNLGTALQAAPRTATYFVYFHIGKTDYASEATRFPDGEKFALNGGAPAEASSQLQTPLTTNYKAVTGVFDVAHNEVRVNVPISTLRIDGPVTRGYKITNISAVTYVQVGAHSATDAYAGSEADTSDTTAATYVIGSPSCVRVGT